MVRVAFRKTAMSATDVGMNGGSVLAGFELVEMVALDGLVGELFVMPGSADARTSPNSPAVDGRRWASMPSSDRAAM